MTLVIDSRIGDHHVGGMTTVLDLTRPDLGIAGANAHSHSTSRHLHEDLAESAGSAETPQSAEKMPIGGELEMSCRNLPKPAETQRRSLGAAGPCGAIHRQAPAPCVWNATGRQKRQKGQEVENPRKMSIR
jgi:hypothetical protein